MDHLNTKFLVLETIVIYRHYSIHTKLSELGRFISTYHETSNISRTIISNKIVDHSDVVGAWPVGVVPTHTSIFDLTTGFNGLGKDNCKTRGETSNLGIWCVIYKRFEDTTYAPPFRPPFFRSLENLLYSVDPIYFSENEENIVFRPLFFIKNGQNV